MKPIKLVFILVCFTMMLPLQSNAQTYWKTNGNFVAPGDFIGTTNNQMLDFKTNNILRMQLMQTSTQLVDGYTIDNSGFLSLSLDPTYFGPYEPFSLIHLNGDNQGSAPQQWGYRPWMRSGITFTDNRDFMYIGPYGHGTDHTDAVIAWADNKNQDANGPDVLRFLFTNRAQGNTSVSTDVFSDADIDGVEVGRMTGKGFTGLGSYWNNTFLPLRTLDVINQQDIPQFRITRQRSTNVNSGTNADFQVSSHGNLHILPRFNGFQKALAIGFLDDPSNLTDPFPGTFMDVGGLTRIRELKDDKPITLIMGYHVDDVNLGPEDQFLGRLDFPTEDPECMVLNGEGQWIDICDGIGGLDCRWEDINSATIGGEQDMRMGFDPTTDCYRGKLGVGTEINKDAKMEVRNYWDRDQVRTGLLVESRGDDDYSPNFVFGTFSYAQGTFLEPGKDVKNTYVGVKGNSHDGGWTVGVLGQGGGSYYGINEYNIGVYATASGSPTGVSIGLYAQGDDYAIMSYGLEASTGSPVILSDESVKTDVQPISNATDILTQLLPKSYLMVNPEGRDLNFDDDLQYGFLAQEVEPILPNLVEDFNIPDVLDSTGFVENTHLNLKGIQYDEFIPLLVAGFQEQNAAVTDQAAKIASQNDQIATMEAQLETQANQLQEMQNQMAVMLESVQAMQAKTANCCNCPTKGSTGAFAPNGGKEMQLEQNVPNPFTNQTRIEFSLPESAEVILEITDATGRPLERLIDAQMTEGGHSAVWDASGFAPGVYFYTLYANGQLLTKKMIKN